MTTHHDTMTTDDTTIPEPLPVAALEDIAAGLAAAERGVPLEAGGDPAAPRSRRLLGADRYDVWLISWPPGSEIGVHDHGGSTSVMRVVRGALVDVIEERGGAGCATQVVRPGISLVTPPHVTHRLHHREPTESTSVHVYSPPLEAVTYRDAGARVAPVRSGRAEATTADAYRPRFA